MSHKGRKGSERAVISSDPFFSSDLFAPAHNNQRTKFVVRRVPSATLGKNADDGLYSKYCSLSAFFVRGRNRPLITTNSTN